MLDEQGDGWTALDTPRMDDHLERMSRGREERQWAYSRVKRRRSMFLAWTVIVQ